MLIQSIAQYLTSHKRLVVPQLGTFIVKDPGKSILFSELLKRDDGVLRGVLREAGLSELEAAGEIDRFVFEARHAIQSGATYPLEGLGELMPGANGTIAFRYDPSVARATAPAEPEPASEPAPEPAPAAPASSVAAAASASAQRPAPASVPSAATASAGERPAPSDADAPHSGDAEHSEPSDASRVRSRRVSSDRVARSVEQAFTDPYVSPSAKMNPDPSVRGLRYGKPPKNTSGYTFVDRPTRRRADRFLWIAIAAAVIALGAIAFGYWRERHDQEAAEKEYLEYRQMIDSPSEASGTEASEAQTAQPAQTE